MPGFIRIAHRGAPRRALENTLESFRVARLAGARFFELDVWLSKDGVPMVCHDKCLRRISGHKGKVSMLTRSQIQEINLPNGERIPTLKEVLSELEDAEHTIYVEMKDQPPCCVDLPGCGAWNTRKVGAVFLHYFPCALSSRTLSEGKNPSSPGSPVLKEAECPPWGRNRNLGFTGHTPAYREDG